MNMSEKPSQIKRDTILKTNKVDQHAYQALLLIRTLPCILYDKLDLLADQELVSDIKYLVSLHLRILSIIFSTEINLSTAESLEQLWIEHTLILFAIFPECRKINKIHQIFHYFELIIKCGPCRFYNTCRFESKHQFFKKKATVSNNFINPTKTLSFAYSYDFLYNLKYSDSDISSDLITDNEKRTKSITFNNITYKQNAFLCITKSETPVFGKIIDIIVRNGKTIFFVEIFQTMTFLDQYYGYQIKSQDIKQYKEVMYEKLPLKEVFCIWRPINSNIRLIFKDSLIFD